MWASKMTVSSISLPGAYCCGFPSIIKQAPSANGISGWPSYSNGLANSLRNGSRRSLSEVMISACFNGQGIAMSGSLQQSGCVIIGNFVHEYDLMLQGKVSMCKAHRNVHLSSRFGRKFCRNILAECGRAASDIHGTI